MQKAQLRKFEGHDLTEIGIKWQKLNWLVSILAVTIELYFYFYLTRTFHFQLLQITRILLYIATLKWSVNRQCCKNMIDLGTNTAGQNILEEP